MTVGNDLPVDDLFIDCDLFDVRVQPFERIEHYLNSYNKQRGTPTAGHAPDQALSYRRP